MFSWALSYRDSFNNHCLSLNETICVKHLQIACSWTINSQQDYFQCASISHIYVAWLTHVAKCFTHDWRLPLVKVWFRNYIRAHFFRFILFYLRPRWYTMQHFHSQQAYYEISFIESIKYVINVQQSNIWTWQEHTKWNTVK